MKLPVQFCFEFKIGLVVDYNFLSFTKNFDKIC